ncbi:MAG: class II aldolase/adducin family protein [Candidatus Cloacimonadaceae bacterium]|nr:class II aldolase/adducin family protein [Candidatus Cloacimonadaceae bacterium]MDP3114916.1 class II aldolase/adducin family protein [Candidatus Cloacimonadaceae bacterium]
MATNIIKRCFGGIGEINPCVEGNEEFLRLIQTESNRFREILATLADIGARIWQRGWAEANAGNVSINVTDTIPPRLRGGKEWFLVSQSGSRYRQLTPDPIPHLVLISIGSDGENVHPTNKKPTSEWACHRGLLLHFLASAREDKVILHAHPADIIALSQMPVYETEAELNRALIGVLPEMQLYLTDGIALTHTQAPGSQALADCSLSALGKRKALIWQKHGILCIGKTLDEAFDYLEIVAKAAAIYLKMR